MNGIDIWKHSWQPTTISSFKAPHPQHKDQLHDFTVYRVKDIYFAASEVSNCVWCIYVKNGIDTRFDDL